MLTFAPYIISPQTTTAAMDYAETLQYLFTQLPMFQRVGSVAYKANLNNTLALDAHYGHPHQQFRTIHVAGTNGKGSTSHSIAAVLQQAGYRVGLYTSPHLRDFRERIRINGEMIAEDDVVRFVSEGLPLFKQIQPSFFEITVAMAFSHFAHQQVDVAVIEVGLGGRLDSTNIITPELSVITNIALDHVDLLGHTVQQIASEKAGIIKPNVPVVLGQNQPATNSVFEQRAMELNAPLTKAWEHYLPMGIASRTANHQLIDVRLPNGTLAQWTIDLMGQYQQLNLPGVLCSIDVLRQHGFSISPEHIQNGLRNVQSTTGLRGRWQRLGTHPDIFCDIGHNADGIAQVVEQIKQCTFNNLHFVLGVAGDKDLEPMLSLLPTNATYYFAQANIPRALNAQTLTERAERHGLRGHCCGSVANALKMARSKAQPEDLIVVGGSAFVVAEVV